MELSWKLYILLCVISVVKSVSNPKIPRDSYCYDEYNPANCGPSNWEGLCNIGTEQSPVDINFNSFDSIFYQRKTAFSLSQEYFQHFFNFYAINDGHTLTIQLDPTEETSTLVLEGADLIGPYVFAQLHFHWGESNSFGSEHTVHGRRYPMEAHIVHYKSIYGSLSNAMEQDDREAIAVLAVFFEISDFPNVDLEPIFEAAREPEIRRPGPLIHFNNPLAIASLFPWKLDFVRYLGSLTTPTCDENVIWTVFRHPIQISEFQMNSFRRLRTEEGLPFNNFRPTQPINGRRMIYYKSKEIHSFFPLIDRISSVTGLFSLSSETKHLLSEYIWKTIITPAFILTLISNILFKLFHFTLPVIMFYK